MPQRYSAKPEGMTPLMEYDPVTGIAREAVLSKSERRSSTVTQASGEQSIQLGL